MTTPAWKLYDILEGKGHDHNSVHELDDLIREEYLESCTNMHTCNPPAPKRNPGNKSREVDPGIKLKSL